MKQFLIWILVGVISLGWAITGEIKWNNNLEDGLKNQKTNGRDILIYFGASWCAPCKKMEKEVFASEKFIEFSESFEMVKIYDDFKKGEKTKHDYYESTKEKFNITGIPSFVVIKSNNGKQFKFSGGYNDPEELIKQINSCK